MKNGLSLMFLVWMILLVHHADLGRATSSRNVNGSLISTACGGSVNCLIGGCDLDDVAEFQMHSHVARMLFDANEAVTRGTGNKNKPAVDCPPNTQYTVTSCLGPRNGKSTKQPCGDYTRPGSGCN